MKYFHGTSRGFTVVEMMVALAIGLIVIAATVGVYQAQSQMYTSANSQATIQSAENAIAALVAPTVRGAGFLGCSGLRPPGLVVSNLVAGAPPPLGTLGTTPAPVAGYEYLKTGSAAALTLASENPANSNTASDWTPALDASLVGSVLPGSDVLIVLAPKAGFTPTAVGAITNGSNNLTVWNVGDFSDVTATPRLAAISDCLKSTVFTVTGITATTLFHDTAGGTTPATNAIANFAPNYAVGAQVVELVQTAFFVSHPANGGNGQSVLMRADWNISTSSWDLYQLVPGVENMQVLYGINSGGFGATGGNIQYVRANAVTNWANVVSVQMGFLLEGAVGSAAGNAASSAVLSGTTITVPTSNVLRHPYELVIGLRN